MVGRPRWRPAIATLRLSAACLLLALIAIRVTWESSFWLRRFASRADSGCKSGRGRAEEVATWVSEAMARLLPCICVDVEVGSALIMVPGKSLGVVWIQGLDFRLCHVKENLNI